MYTEVYNEISILSTKCAQLRTCSNFFNMCSKIIKFLLLNYLCPNYLENDTIFSK